MQNIQAKFSCSATAVALGLQLCSHRCGDGKMPEPARGCDNKRRAAASVPETLELIIGPASRLWLKQGFMTDLSRMSL